MIYLQEEIGSAVKELLALKAEYKQLSGSDYKPPAAGDKKSMIMIIVNFEYH